MCCETNAFHPLSGPRPPFWSMVKSADHKCNNGSYVRWNTPTPDSRRFDPVPRFRYLTLPYY